MKISLQRFSANCLACILLLAGLFGCATTTTKLDRSVQIQRTAHGIAHITASDHEGIAYGVAYAHAEDNVCQTADHLVTVRGERSKFFGPSAQVPLGLRQSANDQFDFFIRFHMNDDALRKANRATSSDAQASARGYIAGYNRYLADTGVDKLPLPCRGAVWVSPMTERDYYRIQELMMVLLSSSLYSDAILAAQPPAAPAAVSAPTPPLYPVIVATEIGANGLREMKADSDTLGSNGWAFGKDTTSNKRGLLLGNPHFPWQGINRFWQMHLVIPGKLDVMGTSIGHNGFVLIGFNKDVAWTHTVSTGKRFTLHEITLDPKNPTAYLLDGTSRKLTPKVIEIEALGNDGKVGIKQHTFWTSVWGPIIVMPRAGLGWSQSTAYAMKDANAGNTRAADAWMAMNNATSVDELRNAIGSSALPWVNTIAADRHGQAMYADLSVVPDVTAEHMKRCAPSARASALFKTADIVVLDGSRGDCDWNHDPSAPVPGLIPSQRMPVLIRNDWVQNSNDSYWFSNPAVTIPNMSPLVGQLNMPLRLRTRSGVEEIRGYLAVAKSVSGNKIGMREVQELIFLNRNKAGQLVAPDLIRACANSTDSEIREGCAALQSWDLSNNIDSRGAPLFREFWREARNIPNVWRVPFSATDPLNTPSGLNFAEATVRDKVFEALIKAVRTIKKAGFASDATLGAVQFKNIGSSRIAIHGGDEFEGVLNKIGTIGPVALNENGFVVDFGTSYIQSVTFDERGPIAQALLTYGQSSDPASKFSYDQLPNYSRKQWIDLPFHASDVEAKLVGPAVRLLR